MRILVRRKAVEMFISGARMVKFVEIHAVQIRWGFGHLFRLVKQCRGISLRSGRNVIARCIKKCQLVEPHRSVRHRKRKPCRRGRHVACNVLPAEHIAVFFRVRIFRAVLRAQQDASRVQAAEYANFSDFSRLAEFNFICFACLAVPRGFRRCGGSKIN